MASFFLRIQCDQGHHVVDSWPACDALHGCLLLQDWDTGSVPLSFRNRNYNFTFKFRNSIEALRELPRSKQVRELCAHLPWQPRSHVACPNHRPAILWQSYDHAWCCAALQCACWKPTARAGWASPVGRSTHYHGHWGESMELLSGCRLAGAQPGAPCKPHDMTAAACTVPAVG